MKQVPSSVPKNIWSHRKKILAAATRRPDFVYMAPLCFSACACVCTYMIHQDINLMTKGADNDTQQIRALPTNIRTFTTTVCNAA
jgi:hypothetical protein